MSEQNRRSLIPGIILIVLGVVFLLDEFDVLRFGRWLRTWWPSVLIALGLWTLFARRFRAWVGPLVLITIGGIFQAAKLELLRWRGVGELWPLILIAIGAGLLIERLLPRTGSVPS